MKSVIINNDDFGISKAINESVVIAHSKGVLRSTTMLVDQDASDEAAEIARSLPNLRVGIHLDLDHLFGLGLGNNFGSTVYEIDQQLYMKHTQETPDLIRRDLSRQIEKFYHYGLVPSHLDGHHFVHQFPWVLPFVIEAMDQFKIRKIRLSRDFYKDRSQDFAECKDLLDRAGVLYPDDFFDLDEELFGRSEPMNSVFRRVKEGVTEIMTHLTLPQPGELEWRVRQFEYLTGDNALKELRERDIELISFDELL